MTTPQSPIPNTSVTGIVVGTDPRPPKHQRKSTMYLVVKVEGQESYVYADSQIPVGD